MHSPILWTSGGIRQHLCGELARGAALRGEQSAHYTWKVRYVKALLWGNALRAQEVGLALYHGRVLPLTNRGAGAWTDKQVRFAL
jgi:hypothetical protein